MTTHHFTRGELGWFVYDLLLAFWDAFFGVRALFQGSYWLSLFFGVLLAIQVACTVGIVRQAARRATREASPPATVNNYVSFSK